MSSGRWSELPYKNVASTCMKTNKKLFIKHDTAGFSKYLVDVARGKASISGATLLPHSLLGEALQFGKRGGHDSELMVIEGQWKTMIETLKESGALENSLAVCDVSGSMGSFHYNTFSEKHVSPIFPSVALSIVLAQIAPEPWANSFITFSATPQIVKIDPTAGLVETANNMVTTQWDMNTDFNAVFTKLLLPMAIQHKLAPEDMIKRLFVFSDMEFDESSAIPGDEWKTEHEKVVEAFAAAGYTVPEIVYWNLQGARGAKPVLGDREGVAMLSGFSSNMFKVFMEGGEIEEEDEDLEEVVDEDGMVVLTQKEKAKMTPEDVMKKAVNRPSYATIVVED